MIIQNTLFLTTQGSYAHLDHETIVVEAEGSVLIRVPLHHLGGIVAFGNVLFSPYLIHRLAETGKSVSWMTEYGRFKAQVRGATTGNVLLRMAQHRAVEEAGIAIAQRMVWGKILNQRQVYMRASREATDPQRKERFTVVTKSLRMLAKNGAQNSRNKSVTRCRRDGGSYLFSKFSVSHSKESGRLGNDRA